MILLPSMKQPDELIPQNDIPFVEDFYLYYHNFPRSMTGTAPPVGYSLDYLSNSVYMEYVKWETDTVHLTLTYSSPVSIRSIILGNPSFDKMRGACYLGDNLVTTIPLMLLVDHQHNRIITEDEDDIMVVSESYYTEIKRNLAPGETDLSETDQKLVVMTLKREYTIDKIELTLEGTAPSVLHYLYVGDRLALARPKSIEYGYATFGKGALSDIGVSYGTKRRPRRSLTAKYDVFSDRTRRALERYSLEVQNVVPHVIQPMRNGEEYIPPLFGVFNDPGFSNPLRSPRWHWGAGALAWNEVI
ncbi:MAG: hypothetical protein LBP76_10960 [Treponema sp.]|jgi:hypothetical protein|nr:hypothetical protein [Treponema sp.]